MRKTFTLAIFAAVVFAIYYFWPTPKNELDAWSLVSKRSLAVWEVSDLRAIDSILSFPDGSGMAGILSSRNTNNRQFLQAFQVSGDRLESILFFDLSLLNRDSLEKKPSRKNRLYEGKQILEFQLAGRPFTFTSIEGTGLVSTNPLLIEEAIRLSKAEVPSSFRSANQQLFTTATLKNDAGNFYLDWRALGKAFEFDRKTGIKSGLLAHLCGSLVFDFKITKNHVLLSGFAMDTTEGAHSFLSLFGGQPPVKMELQKMLPEDFEWAVHLGVAQGEAWNKKRMASLQHDTSFSSSLQLLKSKHAFDVSEFWQSVDEEILLVQRERGPVVYIDLREISKVNAQFGRLERDLLKSGSSRSEIYADHTLTTYGSPELCQALLQPLIPSASELTLTFIDDLLIASTDINNVKEIIDQITEENTVGKSVEWGKFLSNTQQEANLSVLVNGQLELLDFGNHISFPYEKASLQFTALDKYFYASSFLMLADKKRNKPTVETRSTVETGGTPRTSLYPVVNHSSKQTEILYQDGTNNLTLVSTDGKKLWQKPLPTPMADRIFQIDFLRNNKLQYLLVTSDQLYVVDRLGNNLKGFPIKLATTDTKYLSLVDYNRTKDYRFLVANERGDIWLYDMRGKALDGWNPKRTQLQPSAPPKHVRLSGRDYFVVVSTSGEVVLWNRRGELVRGFPVSTRLIPSGDFVASEDHLVFASADGHVLKVTSNGGIVNDEVLLKNHANAKFGLCAALEGHDFLIYRIERGKLAFLDSSGVVQFEMSNMLSENLEVRLYSFGGKNFLLVFDPDQQLFMVLDETGKMLTKQPMESTVLPGISVAKNNRQITVNFFYGQTLRSISLAL